MSMSDEDKFHADAWLRQSDILLKLMALIPVSELAIAASWYTLMIANHPKTAHWVAFVGVLVMVATLTITRRTAGYISHHRYKISHLLPSRPPGLLTGRNVGLFLPILCATINFILIFIKL
jgi:hypothetical protein